MSLHINVINLGGKVKANRGVFVGSCVLPLHWAALHVLCEAKYHRKVVIINRKIRYFITFIL